MKFKLLLSLTLLLTSTFTASAAHATTIDVNNPGYSNTTTANNTFLTDEDTTRLSNFGFTDEEIANFTPEQYATFNEKVGKDTTGVLVDTETSYYKITDHQVIEVPESEAVQSIQRSLLEKQSKGINALSDPTSETSWMKMTISSTKMSNGKYNLKNSFRWLMYPTYRLTDVAGISFNPNLTYIQDSAYGNYAAASTGVNPKVDNYPLSAQHKKVAGLGFNVDLKTYTSTGGTVTNHSGYVAFQVEKNNTGAISTNAYGHYAHLYNTISFGVDLRSGALSITGATGVDNMEDNGISWRF
ncbi:hypothetical protein [Paenibacillus illinoisensis]|uniref:hypothetical protein n=1 Tax=Paenibacillus illinoisensis TaxID=59845 RepID=UPI001C8F1210|nr:hypothetical protein [Paenibacillus illinoisensis]MBY0217923.1 hypothetical protein [Paenibacillus illinoisensis]